MIESRFNDSDLLGSVANIIPFENSAQGMNKIKSFRLNLDRSGDFEKGAIVVNGSGLPYSDFAVGDRVQIRGYSTFYDTLTGKPESENRLPIICGLGSVINITTGQTYDTTKLTQQMN